MERFMYAFLEESRRKGLKKNTVDDYRCMLKVFFGFLDEHYPDIEEIADITRHVVLSYEKYLVVLKDSRGKILTRERRGRYLGSIRKFFHYLEKEECIYQNPASTVTLPKLHKRLIKDVLTVEEMARLLESCGGETLKDLRDRAILEMLYSTGIRLNELLNIHTEDIDFEEKLLFVRKGKQGNQRVIPFGNAAGYWTERYMRLARPLLPVRSERVFVTLNGEKFHRASFLKMIKKRARLAGIEKNVTTHTFRHSCATHMLKGKADIRYVQRQLGHREISTTEKYLKLEITDLKEVHERCHPREQEER
jgi:integrase/recombinase XerD